MKKIQIFAFLFALILIISACPMGQAFADEQIPLKIVLGEAEYKSQTTISFPNATAEGSDKIRTMIVGIDKGSISRSSVDNSGATVVTDYVDVTNQSTSDYTTVTWIWTETNAKDTSDIPAILKKLVFNLPSGTGSDTKDISIYVDVDCNETNIPAGATVTMYSPENEYGYDENQKVWGLTSANGPHYYMYVPFETGTKLSWAEAYNAAKSWKFKGLQGYLVTITEIGEDLLLDKITNAGAWSGGIRVNESDIAIEGLDEFTINTGILDNDELDTNGIHKFVTSTPTNTEETVNGGNRWIWFCGPEAGMTINNTDGYDINYIETKNSKTGVITNNLYESTSANNASCIYANKNVNSYQCNYMNWKRAGKTSDEPNNYVRGTGDSKQGEWCMFVHYGTPSYQYNLTKDTQLKDRKGWNDFPNEIPSNDSSLKGYFVEFSGYSGGYADGTTIGGGGDDGGSGTQHITNAKVVVILNPSVVKITLDSNGGSSIDPIEGSDGNVSGAEINEKTPTRDYYDFTGWYKDEACTEKVEDTDSFDANKTVYAGWKHKKVTISFNTNNGTAVDPVVIEATVSGAAVNAKETTRDYYDFTGWYKDEACTDANLVADTDAFDADATVYAGWEHKTVKITFETNGGTTVAPIEINDTVSAADIIGKSTEKTDYDFTGWYKDEACTEENKIESGESFPASITVYAGWKHVQVDISPVVHMDSYTYGTQNVTGPSVSGVYSNPEIDYFYLPKSENFSEGNPGTEWNDSIGSTLIPGEYHMKAVVAPVSYYNGGTTETDFTVFKAKYDKPVISGTSGSTVTFAPGEKGKKLVITILPKGSTDPTTGTVIILEPDGDGTYTFDGLELNTDYEVFARVDGDDLHDSSDWTKCDLNLGLVKVEFDTNGGEGTAPSTEQTYAGGTITAPSGNGITKTGYTFTGWNTVADGSGTTYTEGSAVTSTCKLYAQWAANSYTVEFNANGGEGSMPSQSFTYDVEKALDSVHSADISNPDLIYNQDLTFNGWAETPDGEVKYIDGEFVKNLVSEADGIKTLYAVWKDLGSSVIINVKSEYPQDVTLTLKKGNDIFGGDPVVITLRKTGEDEYSGSYVFNNVPSGTYDIVAEQTVTGGTAGNEQKLTKTQMVRAIGGVCNETIEMPTGDVNSVLEVKAGSRNAVVEGLDEEAEDNYGAGKSVTVKMTIEEQTEKPVEECINQDEINTQTAIRAIKTSETENTLFVFANIDVMKYTQLLDASGRRVGDVSEAAIHTTNNVVQIIIPFDCAGKQSIKMHRYHEAMVQNFTELDSVPSDPAMYQDGTFFVDTVNNEILFYCRLFSTYAISYRLFAPAPVPGPTLPTIIISPTPELTPEPTPEVTPEPTPEPTPEVTPEPTPIPTPGVIKTDVVVADDVPKTEVDELTEEVARKLLDEDELAEIEAGESVEVYVDITNIDDTVSEDEKEVVELLTRTFPGDAEAGMYLDISLYKKLSSHDAERVDTTDGDMLEITIEIPEKLRNTDPEVERKYHLIRIMPEDGEPEAKIMDIKYNPDKNTITFKTDKFATYAIVIEDVMAPLAPVAPQMGDTEEATGWKLVLICSIIAMFAVVVLRRRLMSEDNELNMQATGEKQMMNKFENDTLKMQAPEECNRSKYAFKEGNGAIQVFKEDCRNGQTPHGRNHCYESEDTAFAHQATIYTIGRQLYFKFIKDFKRPKINAWTVKLKEELIY